MAHSDIASMKVDLIIDDRASSSSPPSETATIVLTSSSCLDNDANNAEGDASSVGSGGSRSEERRRKREVWRRQHDDQLRVDGSFPRRRGQDSGAGGADSRSSKEAVSARVVQHLGTKSTAKPHTLPPAVSDDVRVRSNLLRTLGISNGMGSGKGIGGPGPAQGVGGGGNKGGAGGGNPGGGIGGVLQSGGGAGAGAGAGGGEASSSMPGGGGGGVEPLHQGKNAAVASAVVVAGGRSLLSNVRFKEELKYDSDDDADPYVPQSYTRFFGGRQRHRSRGFENKPPNPNSGRTTTTTAATATNGAPPRRRRLGFVDEVQVVPIPMRSEYSNRIKERMYSGRVELSENAQRNVVEFEAEGWEATTVLDDENQFYKCPLTGELIHPVHLAYFNKGVGGEANDDHR